MDTKGKWNYIVKQHNSCNFQREEFIQSLWEIYCSELFGYSKLFKEFESHMQMTIGSKEKVIPDIILKKDNKEVFDIELKQYNLRFSDDMEKQLISYLKLFNLSVGMVVCEEIHLYSYDIVANKTQKYVIDFKENNEDGIRLIELLQKETFSKEEIFNFIKECNESKQNIERIKKELTVNLVEDLIKNYFCKKYSAEEILKALNDIHIEIKGKINEDKSTIITKPPITPPLDFPEDPKFVIIKTSYGRVSRCNGSLYDATRHSWKVTFEKINNYPYVLSVIDKRVQEVYKVKCWKEAELWSVDNNVDGRFEFVGDVASDDIRNLWINKIIPEKYRKKGMASPVVYSDIKTKF